MQHTFHTKAFKDCIDSSYFPFHLNNILLDLTKHVTFVLQEVQEYFADYILNDRLGIIDNATLSLQIVSPVGQ